MSTAAKMRIRRDDGKGTTLVDIDETKDKKNGGHLQTWVLLVMLVCLMGLAVLGVGTRKEKRRAATRKTLEAAAAMKEALPPFGKGHRVLVTGAAGFIGMHTMDRFLSEGVATYGVDSFDPYYSPELKEARAKYIKTKHNVEITRGSIGDQALVNTLLSAHNITHVIHLAAQPGIEYSLKHPSLYVATNVGNLSVLLDAMSRQPQPPFLVYASSSSVYGNEQPPFVEEQQLRPVNAYGVTKVQAEELIDLYARLYNLRSVGLRFFTVYGPWMRPDMAVYIFASKIVKGELINIKGRGLARDFSYIDDVVEGIHRAARFVQKEFRKSDPPHTILNIASVSPHKVERLLAMLEKHLQKAATTHFTPFAPHNVLATGASMIKTSSKLGRLPSTPLSEGLVSFVKWFNETRNPSWDWTPPEK